MAHPVRPGSVTVAAFLLAVETLALVSCSSATGDHLATAASSTRSRLQPPQPVAGFRYDPSPNPSTHQLPRGPVSRAADALTDLMQSYPDFNRRFAGAWISDDGQSVGLAVVAAYWSATAPHVRAVMRLTHPEAPLHIVKVRYSEQELEAVQRQVFAFVYGANGPGPGPGEVSLASVGT